MGQIYGFYSDSSQHHSNPLIISGFFVSQHLTSPPFRGGPWTLEFADEAHGATAVALEVVIKNQLVLSEIYAQGKYQRRIVYS